MRIARRYDVASVCVRPCDVEIARQCLEGSGIALSTVIGFPTAPTTAMKVAEAIEAVPARVVELDMVMNYARLLSEDFDYVAQDIRAVVEAAHSRGLLSKSSWKTAT